MQKLFMCPLSALDLIGCAVIPFPVEFHLGFNLGDFLRGQREFKNCDPHQQFVLGGFGALGNPSSFHHPAIRQLRGQFQRFLHAKCSELFPGRYFTFLPDRFCIRRAGDSIRSEQWHRDQSFADATIYGGWANLDMNITQHFRFVPSSHLAASEGGGFVKYSDDDIAIRACTIAVPPGHLLIFNETLLHEIKGGKIKETSFRLFLKFAVTLEPREFYPELVEVLRDQGVPLIGGSQRPPMFARLHWCNWQDKIARFSEGIVDCFIDPAKPAFPCVYQYMPSLVSRGLAFDQYTTEEIDVYRSKLIA